MKIDFEGARLYVRPGSTDLRKGVTGLLAIIENEMHLDALSNSVFFFCNKSHKLLKMGKSNEEISNEFFISLHSVHNYVTYIYTLSDVHNRTEFLEKFEKKIR